MTDAANIPEGKTAAALDNLTDEIDDLICDAIVAGMSRADVVEMLRRMVECYDIGGVR